ncbi:MAG: cytochrome c-type biogenesis protein CcmH [Actinomycetota bacterium]|nr:cytochrome c-type biogenesis protein CcmH [Actinomycetota bacterium]MDA8302159.1 cytochrome c-type biogenesis protein CcmH [Actinomycetota bacterium]
MPDPAEPSAPPAGSTPRRRFGIALVWLAMVLAVGGALGYDALASGRPLTLDQKVAAIANQVRCPSCQDETAENSTTQTAAAVRATIRQRLLAGQSQAQIEAYLESRYGPTILLRPPAGGLSGLVWVLPVAVAVAAVGGLAVAFRRWQPRAVAPLSVEERALLERARQG